MHRCLPTRISSRNSEDNLMEPESGHDEVQLHGHGAERKDATQEACQNGTRIPEVPIRRDANNLLHYALICIYDLEEEIDHAFRNSIVPSWKKS